jgi:hypothetical protein
MSTLPLGWSFFGLSSNTYREIQSWEYYLCTKHLNVSYSDFNIMPVYLRKYIIDQWVRENTPTENT